MNPFIDVRVLPSYGQLTALVTWTVTDAFRDANFVVFRSPDGINDWKEIGSVLGKDFFADSNLITFGKLDQRYYRIILQKNGKRFDSPSIGTFGTVSRREFGAARKIMDIEMRELQHATEVLIFKLKYTEKQCPVCTDPDTEQQIGTTLCKTCYGTAVEGGYWPGIKSFSRFLKIGPIVQLDSADGTGTRDMVKVDARFIGFPNLRKNDLIVVPQSDQRYLIETNNVGYLNGKIPICQEVQMVLLRRTDIRYQLPLS